MDNKYFDLGEQLYNTIEEETLKEMRASLRNNSEALYNNSKIFLESQRETIAEIKRQNQLANSQLKILRQIAKTKDENAAAALTATLATMEKERALEQHIMESFMDAFFLYHQQINMFLGQEVHLVYVYRDKDNNPTLYTTEEKGSLMTSELASKHRGVISRFQRESTFLREGQELNRQKLLGEFNFNLKGLNAAYRESLERASISKKEHQSGTILIIWKPSNEWKILKVSSEGDLGESYAAFYLKNESSPSFASNDLEILLNDFLIEGESSVKNVDPTSGLLQGDISIQNEDGTSLEFAVKSAGASSMGFKQVIDFAEKVVTMGPEMITEEWLLNFKNSLIKKGRNKIIKEGSSAIKKSIENGILDKMKEQISSRNILIYYN